MAKFHIGQRVRILWSDGWPELAGESGKILAPSQDRGVTGKSEWIVAPDCWGQERAPRVGENGAIRFGPNSAQLEPLQDDKPKLSTWEDMYLALDGIDIREFEFTPKPVEPVPASGSIFSFFWEKKE